jgi:hypothetical protein
LGADLRAAANGMNLSVAVTDMELLTAKAKLLRGATVERYLLADITDVEHVPNPSASRLTVVIGSKAVMILYGAESAKEFERIVLWLQRAAAKNAQLAQANVAG